MELVLKLIKLLASMNRNSINQLVGKQTFFLALAPADLNMKLPPSL